MWESTEENSLQGFQNCKEPHAQTTVGMLMNFYSCYPPKSCPEAFQMLGYNGTLMLICYVQYCPFLISIQGGALYRGALTSHCTSPVISHLSSHVPKTLPSQEINTKGRINITVPTVSLPGSWFCKVTRRTVTSERQQRCGRQGWEVMFNQPTSKIKCLSPLKKAMCHLKLHPPFDDKQIAVEQKGHG